MLSSGTTASARWNLQPPSKSKGLRNSCEKMLRPFGEPVETGLLESGSPSGFLADDAGYELHCLTPRGRRQHDAKSGTFRHDPQRQTNKGETIVTSGCSIGENYLSTALAEPAKAKLAAAKKA